MYQFDIIGGARRSNLFALRLRIPPLNSVAALLLFLSPSTHAKDVDVSPALNAPPEVIGAPYWSSHEDFPADALRGGGQGTVGIRLSVDSAGRVYRCEVAKPSGWPSLDAVTCNGAKRGAHFNPARDGQGQPIYASYSFYTTWINPNARPKFVTVFDRLDVVLSVKQLPPETSPIMWIRQIVEADGKISACNAPDQKADKALARAVCGYLGAQKSIIVSDAESKPVRAVVAWRVGFNAE